MTVAQAPQSFLFGSISGSLVAFALFGGIAGFIGYATARILRRFAAPDGAPSYLGTTPGVRRAIGALVATAILGGVWWWLWSGFYTLDARQDSVTLHYHSPSRERVVPRDEITATRWTAGPRSTRVLVIDTRSGRAYRSTQTPANDAFERRVTAAVAGNGGR